MSITPAPLKSLGEFLRDETWIDMRVVDGEEFLTLERVQILTIVIYRHNELIEVRQEWKDDREHHDETFYIDCDSIRWARPTSFELENVTPHDNVVERVRTAELDNAFDQIASVLAQANAVTPQVFKTRLQTQYSWTNGVEPLPITARHEALLCLYELTEASPLECAKMCGYSSIQPLMSARDKFKRDKDLLKRLEKHLNVIRHRLHNYSAGRQGSKRYSPFT